MTRDIVRDGKTERLTAVLDKTSAPGHRYAWAYRLDCDDDGGDCERLELDLCDDDSSCEVSVECEDGGCRCLVDGDSVDGEQVEGVHLFGDD